MTPRGKWVLLAILLGIWSGAAAWVFTQSTEPRHGALTHVTGKKSRIHASHRKSASDVKVQLELLAANRQRTEKGFGSPKNIFAAVFPEEFTAPGGIVEQLTAEDLAVQAGRQELAQFRYLGYLSRAGRSQAFLAKGNALHIVKMGETIEQGIVVTAIGPSGVTLLKTSTNTERFVSPSIDVPPDPGSPVMEPSQMPLGAAPPGLPGGQGNMPQPFSSGSPFAF